MSGIPVTPSFGYFGKVPSRGDFIQDRLTVGFIDGWNEWLQAIMAVSKEQMGDEWLDCYLTSPVWHFALSSGVCGDSGVIGTLMPSVDQVGRHFYFTLAAEVSHLPICSWHKRKWSEKAEQRILMLLDDETNLVDWVTELKEGEWFPVEQEQIPDVTIEAGVSGQLVLVGEENLNTAHLLHHAYREQFERYCLWWTSGSERIAPCTLVTSGLPLVSQFAAMLDGNWEQWGW